MIIKKVKDKNPTNNYSDTPHHFAAKYGHWDICKLILEKVTDKNPANINGETPLHICAVKVNLEISKIIIENIEDKNPAHNAVKLHCILLQNMVIWKFANSSYKKLRRNIQKITRVKLQSS